MELDRLYRVSKVIDLPDETKVRVRALSDAERQQIELDALSAAMRFDRKIKDTDSNEYMCYIYPLKEAAQDVLVDVLCLWQRGEAQTEAMKEIKDEFIPIPDNASFVEKKAVLIQREEVESATERKREAYVENVIEAARKKYKKLDEETLRKEATARRMQYLSATEAFTEKMCRAVFYGTEKVEGGRFFESIGDVKELDSTILSFLYTQQREVDSLDPWAIVKFRAGRESSGLVALKEDVGESGETDSVVVGVRGEPVEESGQLAGTGEPTPGQGTAS